VGREAAGAGLSRDAPVAGGELAAKLGIHVLELSPERVVATMPVVGNRQPIGVLHGGAHCVLAETVGSMAAYAHAGDGHAVYGIELSASHHRATTEGLVTATATALALGRTLCTHEVVIRDDHGRRLSTVRITNIISPTHRPNVSDNG